MVKRNGSRRQRRLAAAAARNEPFALFSLGKTVSKSSLCGSRRERRLWSTRWEQERPLYKQIRNPDRKEGVAASARSAPTRVAEPALESSWRTAPPCRVGPSAHRPANRSQLCTPARTAGNQSPTGVSTIQVKPKCARSLKGEQRAYILSENRSNPLRSPHSGPKLVLPVAVSCYRHPFVVPLSFLGIR